MAKSTKWWAVFSVFAPKSSISKPRPSAVGKVDIKAGRDTCLILLTKSKPAVKSAPVEPADKTASASPFFTAVTARTSELSFFDLMAATGSS